MESERNSTDSPDSDENPRVVNIQQQGRAPISIRNTRTSKRSKGHQVANPTKFVLQRSAGQSQRDQPRYQSTDGVLYNGYISRSPHVLRHTVNKSQVPEPGHSNRKRQGKHDIASDEGPDKNSTKQWTPKRVTKCTITA